MDALYAFLRLTDDLGDGEEQLETKSSSLQAWQDSTKAAYTGHFTHPIHEAFHHTVTQFNIPWEVVLAPIMGVQADLTRKEISTEIELETYCDQVAGAVGVACLHIWGCSALQAPALAMAAGRAFQRTNILRDLAEDRGRGRVYIPREDCKHYQAPADTWSAENPAAGFKKLLAKQIELARLDYQQAEGLLPLLPPPGRAMFWLMHRTYSALLNRIETLGPRVLVERARVPRSKKALMFARAWLIKWKN